MSEKSVADVREKVKVDTTHREVDAAGISDADDEGTWRQRNVGLKNPIDTIADLGRTARNAPVEWSQSEPTNTKPEVRPYPESKLQNPIDFLQNLKDEK